MSQIIKPYKLFVKSVNDETADSLTIVSVSWTIVSVSWTIATIS